LAKTKKSKGLRQERDFWSEGMIIYREGSKGQRIETEVDSGCTRGDKPDLEDEEFNKAASRTTPPKTE